MLSTFSSLNSIGGYRGAQSLRIKGEHSVHVGFTNHNFTKLADLSQRERLLMPETRNRSATIKTHSKTAMTKHTGSDQ